MATKERNQLIMILTWLALKCPGQPAIKLKNNNNNKKIYSQIWYKPLHMFQPVWLLNAKNGS